MKAIVFLLLCLPICAFGQSDTLKAGKLLELSGNNLQQSAIHEALSISGLLFGNMYYRLYIEEQEPQYLRAAIIGYTGGLVFGYLSFRQRLKAAAYLEQAGKALP